MGRVLRGISAFGVTLLLAWWAFRNTNWAAQRESVASANYLWLLPFFAVLTAMHFIRAVRWKWSLDGVARLPFSEVNRSTAVGYMLLLLLPFRLGELARPILISRSGKVPFSSAMATIVIERIADATAIALLLRAVVSFLPRQLKLLPYLLWASNLIFVGFLGLSVVLALIAWQRERAAGWIHQLLARYSTAWATRVSDVVRAFAEALRYWPSASRAALFFVGTCAFWGLHAVALWALGRAFDCSSASTASACVPLQLSFFACLVLTSTVVIGSMIPSAPGMAGTFQAAARIGLSLFLPGAVLDGVGMAYANVLWIGQTLQQVLFGAVFLVFSDLSLKGLVRQLSLKNPAASAGVAAP